MKLDKENIEQVLSFTSLCETQSASNYTLAKDYLELLRLARLLAAADVRNCNSGYMFEDGYEKTIQRIANAIDVLAIRYGLEWYHQSDPRGASLYIAKGGSRKHKRIDQMNYNSIGVAIY